MKRFLLAAVLGWITAGAGLGQQAPDATGIIRGAVIDDTGLHVAGARVKVHLQDGRPSGSVFPHSESDKDGAFVIDHLVWGLYEVFADKEDDGYIDTLNYQVFYPEAAPLTAELTSRDPTAEVLVRLPRAGRVSWSASDARNGEPVSVSMRMFRWLEGDDNSRTLYGETHGRIGSGPNQCWMLAPPGVYIGLSGRAPGYEVWRYPTSVRLKPGDIMTIEIKLQPLAK